MKPKNFLPREQYLASLPTKRSGTGIILRDARGKILLVKPSYKNHWSLPGGMVDVNESPASTCVREAKEELDIDITVKRLLAVLYNRNTRWGGEAYQFIFDGGVLLDDTKIVVDGNEILEAKFVGLDEVGSLVGPKRAKYLPAYIKAINESKTVFIDAARVYG